MEHAFSYDCLHIYLLQKDLGAELEIRYLSYSYIRALYSGGAYIRREHFVGE